MAKRRVRMPTLSGRTLSERDGRELAVALLKEMEATSYDLTIITTKYRNGAAQSNVVLRYLDALRNANCRALDIGFGAILSDYLGSTLGEGACPNADSYDDAIDDDGFHRRTSMTPAV